MAEQAGHGDGYGGAPRRDPGLPNGAACAPGWHQWETPSGRTYIQGPKRYPV